MTKVYNSPPNWPRPPDGWRPPHGWLPNPAWGPAPADWQFWVDAPWAEAEADDPRPAKRRWLWPASLAAVLVTVVTAVLLTGGKFGAVEVSPDGLRVEFDNSVVDGKQGTPEDVAAAQPQLEEQITSLEEQAPQQPEAAASATLDITGVWQGDDLFTYTFEQYGSYLVWYEQSPQYDVTAAGDGYVDGQQVFLQFQAFDGSIGNAQLVYGSGALSGSASNATTTGIPIRMRPISAG